MNTAPISNDDHSTPLRKGSSTASSQRLLCELLTIISWTDLKLKYQNSALGFLWSFLRPMLQFTVFYTVFGKILKISTHENYSLELFFGVLVWAWFSESTSLGLNSYIGKRTIISKIRVNRLVPPLSAYLTPTMNFMLNMSAFTIAYILFAKHIPAYLFSLSSLCAIVSAFLFLSCTIISFNIILANLNVFYRDVQPVWELVLAYGVFLTPIIYHIPIPPRFEKIFYALNLIALPLETLKHALFSDTGFFWWQKITIFLPYIISLTTLCLLAYLTQSKMNKHIVDYL